tara:strand:+ start:1824 stop:2087 length:264 start_codon:yes stop_codon:yes gene_type:complete
MSNNNSINTTVYTGTFITKRGNKRTMNFIRPDEAPQGTFPSVLKERNLSQGMETVYDIDRQAYRTFNSNTQVGSISSTNKDVTVELF